MRKQLSRIKTVVAQIGRLHLPVYAANVSFFLLISAFPAAMLLVTLLRFLPLDASDMLDMSARLLPKVTQELAAYLVNDLYASSTMAVISISAVAALWSASRGALALLNGLNAAYGAHEHRSWLLRRLICVLFMLGLLLTILITLALHVFGQYLQKLLVGLFPKMEPVVNLVMSVRLPIVLAVLVLFFSTAFTLLPARRLNYWVQLPGAILASVGWIGFSSAYSLYIDRFSRVSYLYGSLTAVVVTMLWLYFSMCIALFGALLNRVLLDRGLMNALRERQSEKAGK